MKKTTVVLLTLLALAVASLAGAATRVTWTGWITDDHCGAKGASADHKACAEKCVQRGGKLVFYNNGDQKLYALDKQDLAKANLGQEVRITGDLDGSALKVDSIGPANKAGQ